MRMTASRVYMRPQPVPKMPPGMVELMEGLTRDILQNNPSDVYGFCCNHMQKLLEIRDGPVSKRPLSLEEKIARVQQKLRKRAEQRKRQYDKEIKLRSGEKNGKSKAKNSHEIIAKPSNEEEETQIISEYVAESSFKAPVHHEHELRDDLEVEIYHEPSDDLQTKEEILEGSIMTENKDIKEKVLHEFSANEEQQNENPATKETTSNDSTMSETDGIRQNDKFSDMDENEIENPLQIRKPRNVEDFTENDGKNVLKIGETKTQSAEIVTPNQLIEKIEAFEEKSYDNFNYTQTVINESVSDLSQKKIPKELESSTDVSENEPQINVIRKTNLNEVISSIITEADVLEVDKEREQNEVKNPETNNTVIVNVDAMKESEENENMNVMVSEEKNNTSPKTTPDEKFNEERNDVKNIANENVPDGIDELEVNINVIEKKNEHHENPSSVMVNSGDENYDPSDVTKEEAGDRTETIIESKEVIQYNKDNGTVDFTLNKNVEGGIKEKKQSLEPFIDKESEGTSDSLHTSNSDGTISEHRILVVELGDVRDDNASVPVQNIQTDIDNRVMKINSYNLTDTPVDVTNEDIVKDFLAASEPCSDKPDTDQLSKDIEHTIHERSKRNLENISEGIETTSNTTDVGKSDNETISSLGKLSSVDDSALEDFNENVGNEIKTNGKSLNYTNSSVMDLETAAVTIQKVFRTFLFKSRASTFEDSINDDNNLTDEDSEKVDIDLLVPPPSNLKERRGIARMDTVLQTVNEEKSLSLSTDESSLSSAATVIQAHVRGFLVRNKLNSKTTSSASLVNSDGHSTSLEAEVDQNKPNKTVLNIIVPEGGHYLSRDESVLTSMDLSLDGSPPSSVNLHPLGYDKREPRKQLKRGDAIQSISPPSNNSGKLSEDVDSMKEVHDSPEQEKQDTSVVDDIKADTDANSRDTTPTKSTTVETVVETHKWNKDISPDDKTSQNGACRETLTKMSSDESDVVTPFEEKNLTDSDNTLGLLHSGEFHDVVLPTKILRSDTTVVRGE